MQPPEPESRMHRNSSERVPWRVDSALLEWPTRCVLEVPDWKGLYGADHGEFLPLRYSGSRGSAHTIVCQSHRHLQVWTGPLRLSADMVGWCDRVVLRIRSCLWLRT